MRIGILVVMVAVCGAVVPARADDNTARADALFVEGREFFKKGDAKAACEKFHAANALAPAAPGVMYNLGLCYEKLGKLATSLKWYRKAQTAASEAKPRATEFEEGATERKRELATKVAHVEIGGEIAAVDILVDGTRIDPKELASGVEVDSGPHKIEATAPGKATHSETVEIVDGETKNITIPPLANAPKAPRPVAAKRDHGRLGKILIFSGAPLLVVVPIPAVLIWREAKDRGDGYTDGEILKQRILGGVWIASLAAVGVGTYFVITKPKPTKERSAVLAPVVTPDHVGFSLAGRF
jgi:hypothetical protein